jgi:hypothetical protein
MDVTNHLTFVVSLIVGLAIVDLLTTLGRLIRARDRVRFHWIPLIWAGLIFMQLVQAWWTYYYVLRLDVWREYFAYMSFLIQPMLLYLIASWVLPRGIGRDRVDLEAHYFKEHRWLFGLMATAMATSIAQAAYFVGAPLLTVDGIPGYVALLLFISMAWVRSPRFHAIATLLLVGVFMFFLVTYNPPLVDPPAR